jgi:hypothetical protein
VSAWSAVSAGTGNAAAASHGRAADVPAADSDDLVPIADPRRAYRDHNLVRRRARRRSEVEHAHVAAEYFDAGGLHPAHSHQPGILAYESGSGNR